MSQRVRGVDYSRENPRANPGPPDAPPKKMENGKVHRMLKGNFYPTSTEGTFGVTVAEGKIPSDLTGMFARVGPNPYFAVSQDNDYHA